jgi:hypothetical protein
MSRPTDQERLDAMLLDSSNDHYSPSVPGLWFVVPPECAPDKKGDRSRVPGVYIRRNHPNSSPTARLRHEERLLTPREAIEWAATCDQFCRPRSADGGPDRGYPRSYAAYVRMFYAALARGIGAAVEATEERRLQLREVSAALNAQDWTENDTTETKVF